MPHSSRRTRVVIIALASALVLSLSASALIAVAWSRDREANRVALANDAARIHMLEKGISSPSAQSSVAPTVTPPTTSSSVATAPAATGTPAFVWPYAQLTHMTDSLGSDWIYPSMYAPAVQVQD